MRKQNEKEYSISNVNLYNDLDIDSCWTNVVEGYRLMGYFGVIPVNIRHNPNLTMRDKVVYAEITATTDENGISTKNNAYFARVLCSSKGTISASITKLRELGYISVTIEKQEKTEKFIKRYISLTPYTEKSVGGSGANTPPYTEKSVGVRDKNTPSTEDRQKGGYTEPLDSYYYSNNIRYIYNSCIEKKYNKNITSGQLEYLKNIVTEFYTAKRKQYPAHIDEKWYDDHNLIVDSVNTLYMLITKDRWGEKDVRDAIRWATDDKFWRKNLMSLKVLRKKSGNGQTKFANIHIKFKG
ncbi:MAG: hypothetical protein ACE5D6_08910 [Candidatus Zixiibacteriota bacterium]